MISSPLIPTRRGRLLPFLVLAAAVVWAVSLPPAEAGDKGSGKIDLEARLDPSDMAPGGEGLLVIKATLLNKEHKLEHFIYAAGEKAIKYKPIEAAGVTYHLDKKTITKPGTVEDFGETYSAWENEFTLRVPISFSKDVKAGTVVGMSFDYYGCIKKQGCYAPIKGHKAAVVLGGGGSTGMFDRPTAAPGVNPSISTDPEGSDYGDDEADGGTAAIHWDEVKSQAVVTFTPAFLHHMYGSAKDGSTIAIGVEPVEAEGVTWGKFKISAPHEFVEPVSVRIPVGREESAKRIAVRVTFQACHDVELQCKAPVQGKELAITWPGGAKTAAPKEDVPKGEVLFPVVEDDELGQAESESSLLQRLLRDTPLLGFGFIFIIGLGLAFTPCVLPILPITVSVISGGNPDIPPKRLAALLATYVLGLCMTFATMGVIAAMTGGAMSALFAMPAVQWGFVVVFLALAFAMYGIYELQPPAFLMNLQGGAQKRSGSVIGAFMFGCLGAIIASPCTGPAIAVLLIETAKTGSEVYGFAMFFTLGLGMGAVLFAAGSLNFLMRPGPWMVWVRHTFGIAMVAVAIYYLSQYQLIGETARWIIGGAVCVLIVLGLTWHRHKKEGEELGVARMHALKVGVLTFAAVAFVAWYTKVPDNLLSWTYVKSPEHLQELVADANKDGKPVVVDFWGDWCTNCKVFDERIATTPTLRERFERITRIKVDLSEDYVRWPMRHSLGVEGSGAPIMVFIDRQGRIRRNADVVGLIEDEELAKHIDVVLRKDAGKTGAVETGDAK